MSDPIGCAYPWTIVTPDTLVIPIGNECQPLRTEQGGPGGGGEWVIWGRPDYPASRGGAWKRFERMDFKRPTRRQK